MRMVTTALIIVVVGVIFVGLVSSLPTGAPTCADWHPQHGGLLPQPDPAPYTITVSSTRVVAGHQIVVTLSGETGDTRFKGFHLRAIDGSSGLIVGNFVDDGNRETPVYHTLSCDGQAIKGAITHNDPLIKQSVQASWIAPAEATVVVFTASVVKQFDTFWENVKSVEVMVEAGVKSVEATVKPSTDLYLGCGVTKSCFGMPGGDRCIGTKNCQVIATFVKKFGLNVIDFELMGVVSGIGSYIAVGFSSRPAMDGASVRECVIKSDGISGSESYNVPTYSNMIVGDMDLSSKGFADGVLDCKFSLDSSFVTRNFSFDLIANNYYVLLATGQLDSSQKALTYHAARLPSVTAFNFSAIETSGAAPINKLVALHGSLMIVSWVGTVSVAIFLARYYKQMWPETTHCKVRVWFAWHRGLNTLTVLLSSAAFVIIFVHVNGWSKEWPANPHPVTGTVTFGLLLLQPIMALFRCDPGSAKRPIFNWLHFLVGMIAVILAVVTMFFAVTLRTIDLPQYFWWILIAYVAFFVIAFANMEFFTCLGARNEGKESIAMHNYPIGPGNVQTGSTNSPMTTSMSIVRQARFKQVMLIVFVAGALGFSAALVVVVATS